MTAKLSTSRLEVFYRGEKIASHGRCFEKKRTFYELGHYIPLLEKKPRSVNNAAPVVELGVPPQLRELAARSEDPDRVMVRILKLCAEHGIHRVAEAARRGPVLSLDALRLALWEEDDRKAGKDLTTQDVRVETVDLSSYDRLLEKAKS